MAKHPKLRRPARPRSTSHPFTDPDVFPGAIPVDPAALGNLVCEPIEVPLWWHGPVVPGGRVVCRLQGGPMLPGALVEPAGPGSGVVYRPLPATLPSPRIAGISVAGDQDLLWKVWLKLTLGGAEGKTYVHVPAAALIGFTLHPDQILAWPLEQVLRVELETPVETPPAEISVFVYLLAYQALR